MNGRLEPSRLPSLPTPGFADDKFKIDLQRRLGQLDRPDLDAIKTNPAYIVDAFRREAHNAMILKHLDL